MLVNVPQQGRTVIDAWGDSGIPLIKQLATHGVAVNMHQNPDDKIAWLLEKDWLFRYGLKHEVYQLLALAYPSASEASRTRLLDRVACGIAWDVSDRRPRPRRVREIQHTGLAGIASHLTVGQPTGTDHHARISSGLRAA